MMPNLISQNEIYTGKKYYNLYPLQSNNALESNNVRLPSIKSLVTISKQCKFPNINWQMLFMSKHPFKPIIMVSGQKIKKSELKKINNLSSTQENPMATTETDFKPLVISHYSTNSITTNLSQAKHTEIPLNTIFKNYKTNALQNLSTTANSNIFKLASHKSVKTHATTLSPINCPRINSELSKCNSKDNAHKILLPQTSAKCLSSTQLFFNNTQKSQTLSNNYLHGWDDDKANNIEFANGLLPIQ